MTDPEVLTLAAQRQRVSFPRRGHDGCTLSGIQKCGRTQSPASCLSPQRLDIAIAIEELLLIWMASEASEWENRLEWLPL